MIMPVACADTSHFFPGPGRSAKARGEVMVSIVMKYESRGAGPADFLVEHEELVIRLLLFRGNSKSKLAFIFFVCEARLKRCFFCVVAELDRFFKLALDVRNILAGLY